VVKGDGVDFSLEQLINGPAGTHPLLDAVMKAGAIRVRADLLLIALVGGWFLVGLLHRSPEDRLGAITALLSAASALLANQVIGFLWDRPRPFIAHPRSVHLLVHGGADASFPSDHAAVALAVACVLLVFHRRLGIVALVLAALMCYARVYVGVHYPGDVLGGAAVGAVAAALVLSWLRSVRRDEAISPHDASLRN
jgi:undecaprenyl-diphosphatase